MQELLGIAQPIPVLSVTDLNRLVRATLETDFAEVWVAGEISNFRVPASGHFYFCLKDKRSQLAAVMFRTAQRGLAFRPSDGLDVLAHGRISLYEARGDLQLVVDTLEPRGQGGQQLALEQLKRRLAAEGLFDAARKRRLPVWPRAVGVITAMTGAAIHDIVSTLRSRMPHTRIIVRPVRVQGPYAGADIVRALAELSSVASVEVIIVGRGGGSLEDLWAFNEERVARAIVASAVPVVSAVGHEIDVTLADLAADCRAATPTAAAALVVPDAAQLRHRVAVRENALAAALRAHVRRARDRLAALARHVRDPRRHLAAQRQHVAHLSGRASRALSGQLQMARAELATEAERLHALSPLAVLERGYSIARREDGTVVRSSRDLAVGEALELIFAAGGARVRIESRRG